MYENWDIDAASDISRNHIMFGAIGAWMYKGLGGILPDEQAPGFKNIILKPNFVKGLDQFKASHKSPYGNIVSSWQRDGNLVSYTVEIPTNSTASFNLKDFKEVMQEGKVLKPELLTLSSGTHHFQIKL